MKKVAILLLASLLLCSCSIEGIFDGSDPRAISPVQVENVIPEWTDYFNSHEGLIVERLIVENYCEFPDDYYEKGSDWSPKNLTNHFVVVNDDSVYDIINPYTNEPINFPKVDFDKYSLVVGWIYTYNTAHDRIKDQRIIKEYNKIPWKQIIGMRNRIVHGYDTINLEIVWNTAIESIPELKEYCKEILN